MLQRCLKMEKLDVLSRVGGVTCLKLTPGQCVWIDVDEESVKIGMDSKENCVFLKKTDAEILDQAYKTGLFEQTLALACHTNKTKKMFLVTADVCILIHPIYGRLVRFQQGQGKGKRYATMGYRTFTTLIRTLSSVVENSSPWRSL